MMLYEYIRNLAKYEEVSVCDNVYDMIAYFYNDPQTDEWQRAIMKLAKKLTVKEVVHTTKVIVNLSEVVEKNIDNLKKADLFTRCNIDAIMYDMSNILSGYVSERWMNDFVKAIKEY